MSKMNRLQKLWDDVPYSWRVEIVSVIHTFVPAFIGALAISFEVTGDFSWTKEAVLAAVLAAGRSAFKATWIAIVRRTAK